MASGVSQGRPYRLASVTGRTPIPTPCSRTTPTASAGPTGPAPAGRTTVTRFRRGPAGASGAGPRSRVTPRGPGAAGHDRGGRPLDLPELVRPADQPPHDHECMRRFKIELLQTQFGLERTIAMPHWTEFRGESEDDGGRTASQARGDPGDPITQAELRRHTDLYPRPRSLARECSERPEPLGGGSSRRCVAGYSSVSRGAGISRVTRE